MGTKHDNDGWLDTASTPERSILDLRSVGMRCALTLGRFHYRRASDELEDQRHDAWLVLVFVLSGSQHYRIDGREVEVRGGQGLRILPGQRYGTGGWPEQRGDLAWLILKTHPLPRGRALGMSAAGARAVFSRLADPSLPGVFAQPAGITGMIASAFDAWQDHDDPLGREMIRNQIAALVLASATAIGAPRRNAQPGSANAARIDKVLRWVGEHLSEQVTAEAMAEVSGLSPASFFGEFKKRTGTSPKDYLLHLRIEQAARRLRDDPSLTITQIAHDLGFSSSQYFSTVFRRYLGASPRDWRGGGETPASGMTCEINHQA
jgi:AraC-like DNA-binding protein